MISKYDGDYTWVGCFCIGKTKDGEYRAFDSLEDYEKYRDAEKEKGDLV